MRRLRRLIAASSGVRSMGRRALAPIFLALQVQGCAAEPAPDPSGEISQQLDVGNTPVSQSVQIFGVGDHYIHHVNVLFGGTCSFRTTLGTLRDSVMWVRDTSNTTLGFNDDSGGTLASRVDLTLAAGLYLVDIGGFADSSAGTYTLTVQCGSGELGRFAFWCRKVNVHQSAGGSWMSDADCTSGCNIGGLGYCQKFWPNSVSVQAVTVSPKPNTVWNNAGCGPVVDDFDGSDEFACLAQ